LRKHDVQRNRDGGIAYIALEDTRLQFKGKTIDNGLKRNLDSPGCGGMAAILPGSGRGRAGSDWPVGRGEGVGVRLRGGLSRSGDGEFGIFNRLISRPPFKNLQEAKHLVEKGQVSCHAGTEAENVKW